MEYILPGNRVCSSSSRKRAAVRQQCRDFAQMPGFLSRSLTTCEWSKQYTRIKQYTVAVRLLSQYTQWLLFPNPNRGSHHGTTKPTFNVRWGFRVDENAQLQGIWNVARPPASFWSKRDSEFIRGRNQRDGVQIIFGDRSGRSQLELAIYQPHIQHPINECMILML